METPQEIFESEDRSAAQKAFWYGMTEQRVANMWDAADFIADLSPEGREFLRSADKKTLAFLQGLRAEEIDQLKSGISAYGAFMTTGRILRTVGIVTFSIFIASLTIWEYVAKWLKLK